jgi:hypothetical protein
VRGEPGRVDNLESELPGARQRPGELGKRVVERGTDDLW